MAEMCTFEVLSHVRSQARTGTDHRQTAPSDSQHTARIYQTYDLHENRYGGTQIASKFCTHVARQQHNRSPFLSPYVAVCWDRCAAIVENG